MSDDAFDLNCTYVHLGLQSTAVPLPDFRWAPDYLAQYADEHSVDGEEGRLVMIGASDSTWTSWERHPAGEEVVVHLSGRATLIREVDGQEVRVEMRAGQATINPRGAWHTVDVHEPGQALFITPGLGTEHRPR
ncbi:MAG TPA: cupin domain-containing protein [Acidimicrobiaceae bacterium]|nr:cupin domain-containing protein [Acidimicrobiaceae bacterium]